MKLGAQLAVACFLVGTSALHAQPTIVERDASFSRTSSSWDDSPEAHLLGVSSDLGLDHLYETGWWYRVAGDPYESAFPAPSGGYVQNATWMVTSYWWDVHSRGLFGAFERVSIGSDPLREPSGTVFFGLYIENASDKTSLEIEIFHMADLDINGSSGDSARLVEWRSPGIIQVNDSSGDFAQYVARQPQATGYYVSPYGATGTGSELSNASKSSFTDTGLPFGPGDFTAGWQFSLSVPPGGIGYVEVGLSVNAPFNCDTFWSGVFCDGFESGDFSPWSFAAAPLTSGPCR